MIDISSLEKYIIDDIELHLSSAKTRINDVGFDDWFNNEINHFCNCSFLSKDGRRLMQTNDKRYNYEITTSIRMIELYGSENKDEYYAKLLQRHNDNLEFEAINGFEYDPYTTTKKKSTTSRKKTKQTSLDFGDKPKKETTAEKKLKAHAAKISMLTFKIKPANGNNSL